MKDKIVEIGKELYDDLNALYHTEDATSNKYDMKMDKSGVMKFIELFADRITQLYSAGEEVYMECDPKELTEGSIIYRGVIGVKVGEHYAFEESPKEAVWLRKTTLNLPTESQILEILYDNSAGEWENMGYTMLDELRVEPTVEAIKELLTSKE